MKRRLIALIFIGFICQFVRTQNIDTNKLDNYFDALERNDRFMGSVMVSRDDKLVYSKTIGYSDVENGIKINDSSKYRIGSITKTFTAILVLKAIEKGKIQLNDVLSKYYPEIKNADKITIEQLLYHRSGIHSFTEDEDFLKWYTVPKSENELIDIISKGKSHFEPGSKFEYSNPNYILLSFILQKIYDKPYGKILEENISGPVGLKSTFYGGRINSLNNECYSYSFSENWEKAMETDLSIPMGAGGIVSTTSDLIKFGEAVLEGKIISRSSLEHMLNFKDRFGMGIFQLPFLEQKNYGHTGSIDGFSSMFSYFPETKVSFAILSNGANYNINHIATTVLSGVYGKPFDIPEMKPYEVSEKELDTYLGTYIADDLSNRLKVTKNRKTLIFEIIGEQPLPLSPRSKNVFTFSKAGIVLEFDPDKKTLIFLFNGKRFGYSKE